MDYCTSEDLNISSKPIPFGKSLNDKKITFTFENILTNLKNQLDIASKNNSELYLKFDDKYFKYKYLNKYTGIYRSELKQWCKDNDIHISYGCCNWSGITFSW